MADLIQVALTFAPVGLLLVMSPGPDVALVSVTTLTEGRAQGHAAALGIVCGLCIHCAAALLGLLALVTRMPAALTILAYVGAAYLAWIGVASIREGLRISGDAADLAPQADAPAGPALSPGAAFRRGFLTNVLNPKVALTFLVLMPQFMTAENAPVQTQFAVLSLTLICCALSVFNTLAWLLSRVRGAVSSPRRRRAIHLVAGAIFFTCAAMLALWRAGGGA